jgi:AcrR family transcriptional regulator
MTRVTTRRLPRERILAAAIRVFAEAGYRGATTRRIAAAAGVNEVTLFRHFGSKEELIREAIAVGAEPGEKPSLPDQPRDPAAELIEFGRRQLRHLFRIRSLIRTCMGEGDERPEILGRAMERPIRVHEELRSYLERLQRGGFVGPGADLDAAATMLMGSLFSDAMGRDYMPQAYPYPIEDAPARYVTMVLKAVGWREAGPAGPIE